MDPPTMKMLPVEADVPELLVAHGRDLSASELDRAVGDLVMIAFYYLLRIGEYTIKGSRNETKQTVQLKLEDVTFFQKNESGSLRCLPRDAPDHLVQTADGAMLKLDNKKNGWKGVCIFHKCNGDLINCPVRALGRGVCHIRKKDGRPKTFLSAYFVGRVRYDVTTDNISMALKEAA